MSTPPLLFDRLVDDAAMFPPGNATAVDALAAHLRLRSSPAAARYVGPLLVHQRRWDELACASVSLGSPGIEVIVIGDHRLPGSAAGLQVVGFEQSVDSPPLPAAEGGLPLACEVTADAAGFEVLAEVAAAAAEGVAVIGKFRTGGTEALSFPDEAILASVVGEAVKLGARVKFTAGLHHAIRCTDADSRFEHHGFLNVLVAVSRANYGADTTELVEVLALRSTVKLTAEVRRRDLAEVAAIRRTFVSFGCCGVEEPLHDLVELGLIDSFDAAPVDRMETA